MSPFEDLLTSLESSRLTIEKEQAEINAYKDEIDLLKNRLTQKEERLDERKDKILKMPPRKPSASCGGQRNRGPDHQAD